jgi:hypothetical protein
MRWIDNYVRPTGFPRSLFVADDGRVVDNSTVRNLRQRPPGATPTGAIC